MAEPKPVYTYEQIKQAEFDNAMENVRNISEISHAAIEERIDGLNEEIDKLLDFIGISRHDWELCKTRANRVKDAFAIKFGG